MNMFTLQTLAAKAEQSGEDLGGFMSPERLEIAGQVVLIGMGMVFAVLALLWGVLAIFGKVRCLPGRPGLRRKMTRSWSPRSPQPWLPPLRRTKNCPPALPAGSAWFPSKKPGTDSRAPNLPIFMLM